MAVKRQCKDSRSPGVQTWVVARMAMAVRNRTLADLARELGVTRSAVTAVVRGRRRSARIEQAVARACGIPARELFGRK